MNKTYAETEPSRAEIDALTGPVLIEFGAPCAATARPPRP